MPSKSRYFTGIVYQDSAPDNWVEQLEDSLGMYLISPLHEPDDKENLDTGAITVLKPHWHVIYAHGNTVSPQTAREIMPSWIVLPPKDERFMVGSKNNLTRYFCHLDQPDKQQWSKKPEELLTVVNNFPLDLMRELTASDKLKLKQDIYAYVRDRSITEFNELVDALMDGSDWDMFNYVTDHPNAIQAYLWGVRKNFNRSNQK